MNPTYGVVGWVLIGALAGWVGSLVMGRSARWGPFATIGIGVIGAMVGGFITQNVFGAHLGEHGVLASFGVALLGSCLVIGLWRLMRGESNRLAS